MLLIWLTASPSSGFESLLLVGAGLFGAVVAVPVSIVGKASRAVVVLALVGAIVAIVAVSTPIWQRHRGFTRVHAHFVWDMGHIH
jgi:hypothetical protein